VQGAREEAGVTTVQQHIDQWYGDEDHVPGAYAFAFGVIQAKIDELAIRAAAGLNVSAELIALGREVAEATPQFPSWSRPNSGARVAA